MRMVWGGREGQEIITGNQRCLLANEKVPGERVTVERAYFSVMEPT